MSLEARLAKLERRCRILTIALAAAVVLPAVALLAGAGQTVIENTVRTGQVDVFDPAGNLRVRIGRVNDEFGLYIYDPQRETRAALTDAPDAAGLLISQPGGSIRLLANRLGADVTLRDGKNNVRAVTTATQGDAQFELRPAGGQVITIPPNGE
jgi:hypothetical protein